MSIRPKISNVSAIVSLPPITVRTEVPGSSTFLKPVTAPVTGLISSVRTVAEFGPVLNSSCMTPLSAMPAPLMPAETAILSAPAAPLVPSWKFPDTPRLPNESIMIVPPTNRSTFSVEMANRNSPLMVSWLARSRVPVPMATMYRAAGPLPPPSSGGPAGIVNVDFPDNACIAAGTV